MEKNKTEKLKLRGINQAALITSHNSETGTGTDDCMSLEVYQQLNRQGALNSNVYVYGIRWMTPEINVYGSGSGFDFGSEFDDFGSESGSKYWGSGSGYYGGGWNGGGTSGDGTGGGSSRPGSGNKPTSKAPIELMDKSKFVGWRNGANCLKLCEETLKNYGITNYGSRENIFRLIHEVNGVLTNWGNNPIQNYKNTIECIDKHLNTNRAIIMGVNHTIGIGANGGSTDHFIVITGREFDTAYRKYYYTFMDNATNDPKQGCSSNNRLYYSEGMDLEGDAPVNSWKYTVTQIRPNDGQKYEGTTSY